MTCISLAKASVRAHSRCHHMTRKWSTNPRSVHFGFIGFLDCDRHNNTYIHTIENVIIESIRLFINTFHFFFLKNMKRNTTVILSFFVCTLNLRALAALPKIEEDTLQIMWIQ